MTIFDKRRRRLAIPLAAAACLALAGCAGSASRPTPVVAAQACPPWAYFPSDIHSNAESPYLGCVNKENLRTMVARPADLETGRPLGPADGEHAASSVRTYEEGKIKPFTGNNTMGPSIVLPGGSSGGQ